MLRRVGIVFLLLAPCLPGCVGSEACSEASCENEAVVTYPPGLVQGPYELTLSNAETTETYFCSDPERTPQNPEGITCDLGGFTLVGSVFAARSSVSVSIVDDGGETVIGRTDVTLEAIETVQPNGPDCDPICVIRNGRVLP